MYYVTTKYKTMEGEPHLGYQYETDLIEADGESEALWLDEVVDNQCPSRYFSAIDWASEDQIDLDITDYIGEKNYTNFEGIIYNMDEDEEFSMVRADSMLKACIAHNKRKRYANSK